MMDNGSSQARKIEAFNSGIRDRPSCNVCCRGIKTLVRLFDLIIKSVRNPDTDAIQCGAVISIDLSPTGSILATGSGDWQARICMSPFTDLGFRCRD